MSTDKIVGRLVVVVAVACVAVIAVTVAALAEPAVRAQFGFGPARATSYEVRQRIDLPASAYAAAPRTLVLFARGNCAACRKAAPFFKMLASELAGRGGLQMRVVMDAASDADRTEAIAYVASLGLDRTALVAVDLEATRIKRVPTLVLVDRDGTVLFDWESPMPQDEVLRTLVSLQSAR
jgi:thiol-disulfide isomerase/thioredoxin